MNIATYARTSTSDKEQNLETQLMPLREFAQSQGWTIFREYVDQAPANDLTHRTAWRELLEDAGERRFQRVLVLNLDRAFRNVKHMLDTLDTWETVGISFQSIREQYETSTALGQLLLHLLASLAEFEPEMIRERGREGMERARKQGISIGRPRVTDKKGFKLRFGAVLEALQDERISRGQAAKELNIGYATLKRLLDSGYPYTGE